MSAARWPSNIAVSDRPWRVWRLYHGVEPRMQGEMSGRRCPATPCQVERNTAKPGMTGFGYRQGPFRALCPCGIESRWLYSTRAAYPVGTDSPWEVEPWP